MEDNVAAVLYGPKDLRIEKWPMPEINEEEVLIKMDSVGICGTDVKLYYTGRCGQEAVTQPFVIGHEGAGTVVQVGGNVSNVRVGDRVAVEPTQPCRYCELCVAGRYNLCARPRYCSTTTGPGNMCRYYKHVANFCHKLPDKMTLDEGAAVQPLAIAIHACNRAGIRLGCSLAVLGAGPIGVLCAMSARAMGAANIVMTDVVESRLETARQLGADHTLLVTEEDSEQDTVDRLVELLGKRPDICIEASGHASAQRVAMMAAKTGGVVVVVGIVNGSSTVPLCDTLLREVDLRGSTRILNTYPSAVAAVLGGAIPLKSFITHRYPLEEVHEALELAKSGKAMKIIIRL